MRYRVVNDRDIEARLELKLDPGDRPPFRPQPASRRWSRAEGMLTESEISGTDAGSERSAAPAAASPSSNAELARIEARLARR